jgi:hypothetical protein
MLRLACLFALALAIAACGEADEPVSGADPDQPVQAPADTSPPGGPAAEPASPARCRRVSRRLVGRQLGAAHSIARKAGCALRVVVEDGRSLPVTEDFSRSRINVRIEDGEVAGVAGLF